MAFSLDKLCGILVATENVTHALERQRLVRNSRWWSGSYDANKVAAVLEQIRKASLLNADYAAGLLTEVKEDIK